MTKKADTELLLKAMDKVLKRYGDTNPGATLTIDILQEYVEKYGLKAFIAVDKQLHELAELAKGQKNQGTFVYACLKESDEGWKLIDLIRDRQKITRRNFFEECFSRKGHIWVYPFACLSLGTADLIKSFDQKAFPAWQQRQRESSRFL